VKTSPRTERITIGNPKARAANAPGTTTTNARMMTSPDVIKRLIPAIDNAKYLRFNVKIPPVKPKENPIIPKITINEARRRDWEVSTPSPITNNPSTPIAIDTHAPMIVKTPAAIEKPVLLTASLACCGRGGKFAAQ
jgi:hypothetical protein